ncbi:penicillin acylase family protein [Marivivens niveibacter]|uniref:Penicillin acylase family protein n=1 Tax=Marivivens niveibacter TaxID=1930667 RepID=A0A251X382_9RHOB|nr:penicillin acylase family protein [Marivivens niveibacter]OUD10855.1 penicillin acylase family protein [Marivivens niveibacter]
MLNLFRWMLYVATILFGLIIAATFLAYYFASRSLPDYDERIQAAEISAPIEIVRDNSNVPHIFGETDQDVFFALGFAHAQDRMWQMLTARRTAQGRMAELFGQAYLPSDVLMRRLDLYNLSLASVDAQDDYTMSVLNAYSDGINAWFDEVNNGVRGRGAPEMWLFNQPIAPWQPGDSIALMKLHALRSSGHLQAEVLRADISRLLPDDRLRDILPDVPGQSIVDLPSYAVLVPNLPSNQFAEIIDPIGGPGVAGASNAWAAGPNRSTTGSTLLANDPHNLLTAPTQWYLARLELQSGGIIGATMPGIPVIMSGRSAVLGWGATTAWVDDMDLYLEQVSQTAGRYRTAEGTAAFRTRDSIIRIKDAPAITLKLLWTENGPVLPPDQFGLAAVRPAGHVVTMNWTGLSDQDTTIAGWLNVMRAPNMRAAIRAAEPIIAPAVNLMIADRNGLGMKLAGALPVRDAAHVSQGRMPSFGYLPENQWQGVRAYTDAPQIVDPEGGILGNTNNKTTTDVFPDHVSYVWGDSQRIYRWQRLMQAREVHTRESFIEAQLDTVSYAARSLLPLVGSELWFTGDPAPEGTPQRQRQHALEMLASWNGEMNEHLPEPLIYAAWMRALQDRLIRDELGITADRLTHVDPLFIERVYRDIGGAAAWCDIIQSAAVETCVDIARQSLDEAIIWIEETYGPALESLRWGDAHNAVHTHPVLHDAPLLKWIVNIQQSTSGGDHTLMRGLTSGDENAPFTNVHAAGYRGVYDLADPDSSVFIISTGQSGHPLSRYYDDMGELWRRGEYIPMSLDPTLARAAAVGVTYFEPTSE